MDFKDMYTIVLPQLFKIGSIFSLSADLVENKSPLGEDLGCVIWDIPAQRGSESVRKNRTSSRPSRGQLRRIQRGADSLLEPRPFRQRM